MSPDIFYLLGTVTQKLWNVWVTIPRYSQFQGIVTWKFENVWAGYRVSLLRNQEMSGNDTRKFSISGYRYSEVEKSPGNDTLRFLDFKELLPGKCFKKKKLLWIAPGYLGQFRKTFWGYSRAYSRVYWCTKKNWTLKTSCYSPFNTSWKKIQIFWNKTKETLDWWSEGEYGQCRICEHVLSCGSVTK